MSSCKIFHTWRGPGDTYPFPTDPTASRIDAANQSRWFPFREASMAHVITSGSPSNQSGQQWDQIHEGVNPTGQGSLGNSKPSG